MNPPKKMRRTKIVCTIGPSTNSPEMIRALIDAGMDVARLNFSHGTHESHGKTCEMLREVANEAGKALGIMMDLQGPKIRTGELKGGEPVLLTAGEALCVTTREVEGDATIVSTTYDHLPKDVQVGDHIFLSDGTIDLQVERIDGPDVFCTVIQGGFLGAHMGINLPGVAVSAASLTEKDLADLEFGMGLDIDFVALSFVRTKDDVLELRDRLVDAGKPLAIVAKIERPEALDNFAGILEATDVVMLARGDLGVEVPLNEVPQIQKDLISKCNDVGVPVITATQMLESMRSCVRPTRAEVTDVANAVYDGTDALMLSGETASGQYPVESVQFMDKIAQETDTALATTPTYNRIVRMRQSGVREGRGSYGDTIGQAACRASEAIHANRIVCFTKLGATAALIARYRPTVPITAITLSEGARNRCSLIWGVEALRAIEACNTDELDRIVDEMLLQNNLAEPGDTIIIAGGVPLAIRTRTNMMKLHTVSESM